MKKLILFTVLLCFFSCTKEDAFIDSSQEKVSQVSLTESSFTKGESPYYVSTELLTKYLRLFSRDKIVESITPFFEGNEVLAYYVLYEEDKGWDFISADTRVAPVLSSSDQGILNIEDIHNPSTGAVLNMVEEVKDARKNNLIIENNIWSYLNGNFKYVETKTSHPHTKAGEGGMWVALDTVLVSSDYYSPRLISTSWGLYDPWNAHTPYDRHYYNHFNLLIRSSAGCVPVATGQILYKYFGNTSTTHTIPTEAVTPIGDTLTYFSQYSSSAWSNMAVDTSSNSSSVNQTAIFLSWLGHCMHVKYDSSATVLYTSQLPFLENLIGGYLDFRCGDQVTNISNYSLKQSFCDTLLNSLESGSPAMVIGSVNGGYGHAFIIDYYENFVAGVLVHYQFDPQYNYSEEELMNLPAWRFVPPTEGHEEDWFTEEYLELWDATYIKINWGYAHYGEGTHYNNRTYLLKSVNVYPGSPLTTNYYISWLGYPQSPYDTVVRWYHHFNLVSNN